VARRRSSVSGTIHYAGLITANPNGAHSMALDGTFQTKQWEIRENTHYVLFRDLKTS
jgi:hypothetical protein